MNVTIPITISKAGTQSEPQLIKQYLGGETDNTVLGVMKPNGDIALLIHNDNAIIVSDDNSIVLLPNFANNTFDFNDYDENAPQEFRDDYEWLDIRLHADYFTVGTNHQCCFFIQSLVGYEFELCAYDWHMNAGDSEADVPINFWQVPVEVDPETAFITSVQVQNREFLAISINGIVKPLCDLDVNNGCQVINLGATFDVQSCDNVSAGGNGMAPVPQGVALCSEWDVTSCSVDGGNITTKLVTTVYTMGFELGIESDEKTDAPGTWYLLPSEFSVREI